MYRTMIVDDDFLVRSYLKQLDAWEKAGYAWYDTVCDRQLAQDADFDAFAKLTVAHGEKRSGGDVAAAIEQAWKQVGVL